MKLEKIICLLAFVLLAAGCNRGVNQPTDEDLSYRMSTIFCKTRDEVREYIQQYIPDVTEEQIDKWTAEGKLEAMEIDGELRYFKRSPANLFLLDSTCNAAKFGIQEGLSADDSTEISLWRSLIAECDSTHRPFGLAEKVRVKHSITVNADAVPAGKRLGTAEDDAVDDDERNEDAERGRERRQVRLHEQIDRGHERRDDDDVARDVDRRGNHPAQSRHEPVRADEDERRREPHADRVLKRCRHRQRRAQPEHQPKRRIVLENPVPECQPCFHWLVL